MTLWHHLSSSPKFLPCCGHAMASFVRRQAQSQAASLSAQLGLHLLSILSQQSMRRFGNPCHLAELRGQATDWSFSGGG
jgi:hypothetical protein